LGTIFDNPTTNGDPSAGRDPSLGGRDPYNQPTATLQQDEVKIICQKEDAFIIDQNKDLDWETIRLQISLKLR
jgi:hypothetical protein